jgi:hypothetical protein
MIQEEIPRSSNGGGNDARRQGTGLPVSLFLFTQRAIPSRHPNPEQEA